MRIAFVMGRKNFTVDPAGADLGGGAEKATIGLAQALAQQATVVVIGPVKTCQVGSVQFIHWTELTPLDRFDVVVVWRNNGHYYLTQLPYKLRLKAPIYLLDLHDFMENSPGYLCPSWIEYQAAMVKSRWHYTQNQPLLKLPMAIIPNGLEDLGKNLSAHPRDPYRLCYATSLDRGLVQMLEYSWPMIYRAQPKASFHVYYGRLDFIQDGALRVRLQQLLNQPGVVFHNRVSQAELNREFRCSTYYFYLCNNPIHEADCLAVREAVAHGCLPIIMNHGVFKERVGIKIKPGLGCYQTAAKQVVQLFQTPAAQIKSRSQGLQRRPRFSYKNCAIHWRKLMDELYSKKNDNAN